MILHLPVKILQTIKCFVEISAPNEITGIGTIRIVGENDLYVDRIFLPRQIATNSFCQFKENTLNELIFDLIEDSPERAEELRFRWHSHANGNVFWSEIDNQDIDKWDASWVVNLVTNTRQNLLARLDIFEPFRLRNIPVDIAIDYPPDKQIMEKCLHEYQSKVEILPKKYFPKKGDEIRCRPTILTK